MALSDSAGVGSALPSQVGVTSGYALTTDGTVASWTNVSSGSLPTQTGHAGQLLTTNGTAASWSSTTGVGFLVTGTPTAGSASGVALGADGSFSAPCIWFGTSLTYANAVMKVAGAGLSFDTNGVGGGGYSFQISGTTIAGIGASGLDMSGANVGASIKLKSANGTVFTATISNAGAWVIA